MNRLMVKLVIVVLCTLVLGVAISIDAGYVFIKFSRFEYESSLWVTFALIGFVIFVIWLLFTLTGILFEVFGKINPFSSERKQKLGEAGMRELAEGNWSAALKHLKAATKGSHKSLGHYLGAAQAANELGEYEKSNAFIEAACDYAPKAKIAIGLTFGRLLMARQDYDKALAVANELYEDKPNNPLVIKLVYDIYLQQENWIAINRLLPALAKHKLLPENTLAKLEQYVWSSLLKESFANNKEQPVIAAEQLKKAWDGLPNNARDDMAILETYIQLLCSLGNQQEAEKLLQKSIDKDYRSELVYLYGQIKGNDAAKQISSAERWLNTHSDDAILYLTLGKLCQRAQLWGKAQEYFEKSLQLKRSPEACLELAGYLAQRGETQKSNQLFQESLQQIHRSLYLPSAAKNKLD
ncbi:heme biosynthesis HemY N-terminal domain-containing protein [Entomomonas asaccharolytica]|uniref:Tetratricopeptide repeat protein n=1 Tax=Entomomonas asaccharolytica TaxID=2785331 RepID=A0A974RWH8_9GAMM|nr:heme biosynthesis HemY N-terminal domain-containing protein [Entomomonas asaccharolytica]QQP85218.1 tetratricopeptide repeat protein [Entomomonas asaccharolytica]